MARSSSLFAILLRAFVWGTALAPLASHANEANLRVDENETGLSSQDSKCGQLVRAGWSLVKRNNVPTALEGQVVQGHVASSDFAGVRNAMHGTIDYNFFVYPDASYRGLLAKPGNFETGASVEHGRLEVEWEIMAGALPFAGGFPARAWPTVGDRVYVLGSHILDCGHRPQRSEIHAPRLVVTYRNAAQSDFAGASNRKGSVYAFADNDYQPTPATCVDVFASSYGGESVESEYDNEDINLSELFNADVGPAGAPQTWWQPINDRDYTFDVKVPPRPTPEATTLIIAAIPYTLRGTTGPNVTATALPTGDGWRVKIPFKDWADPPSHVMRVSVRLYAGWVGSEAAVPRLKSDQIRTYKVTVQKLHCYDDLENLGRGNWKLWGYVNEVGQSLLAGDGTTNLKETWRYVGTGTDVTTFSNATFQVTLVDGQPLRVHFRAVEWDDTTDDDAGTAENFHTGDDAGWANRTHTVRSGNSSVMGGEDEHPDCRRAGGCYDVTYRIDRIKPVVPGARAPGASFDKTAPSVANSIIVQNSPLRSGVARIQVGLGRPSRLEVRVYDVQGRVVRELGEGAYDAGPQAFDWDGRDAGGHDVSNGVYFALARFADTGVAMSSKVIVVR